MKNILVTSIGSKIPLLNVLKISKDKYDKNIKIIGADISLDVIGRYFVDKFWKIPKTNLLNVEKVIKYCVDNDVRYIVPTRDEDVLFFAKNKKKFLKKDIFVFTSDKKSVEICNDKYKFSNLENTIPKIEEILDCSQQERYVLKERYGSGSKKIFLNVSKDSLLDLKLQMENPMIQPFIKGIEYSVDSYLDKKGSCIALIIRSRNLVIDGESKITTRVFNSAIYDITKKFLEKHKILGHSVLQIIQKDNDYYIIECNPRFGGASTLSFQLGLESFYWFLLESNNKEIKVNLSNRIVKQVRINKDIYFED